MLALLDSAKLGLDAAFHPDGYNIGINDGEAAGQTVPHLHLHLIPRYAEDREDPRGQRALDISAKSKVLGMTRDEILAAFDRIRVWQQGDRRAVHKPVLELLALGRLLRGEAPLVECAGGQTRETAAGVRPLRL